VGEGRRRHTAVRGKARSRGATGRPHAASLNARRCERTPPGQIRWGNERIRPWRPWIRFWRPWVNPGKNGDKHRPTIDSGASELRRGGASERGRTAAPSSRGVLAPGAQPHRRAGGWALGLAVQARRHATPHRRARGSPRAATRGPARPSAARRGEGRSSRVAAPPPREEGEGGAAPHHRAWGGGTRPAPAPHRRVGGRGARPTPHCRRRERRERERRMLMRE
jgi:hypothetical protein